MDQLFDDTFRPINSPLSRLTSSTTAAINVEEFDNRFEIKVTIPGLNPEDLDIQIEENILNISYNHNEDTTTSAGSMIRQEYSFYSFSRSIALPKNIDQESIQANSHNGILTVTVNKLPQSQPKKVAVKVNNSN